MATPPPLIRLWADFTDIEDDGTMLVKTPTGFDAADHEQVLLFDHEGNRCHADVAGTPLEGFVACIPRWETWANETLLPLGSTGAVDHFYTHVLPSGSFARRTSIGPIESFIAPTSSGDDVRGTLDVAMLVS